MLVIDLTQLKTFLNTEIGVSDFIEIDQARIQSFADLTEDWQWIHVDVVRAAAQSPQHSTVAHGFLTLAFLSRFLNAIVEVNNAGAITSCGLNSVRFISPVPAGSRIRGRVRMRECADMDGCVQVVWRVTVEREGGRVPSCVADWVVRYSGGEMSAPTETDALTAGPSRGA